MPISSQGASGIHAVSVGSGCAWGLQQAGHLPRPPGHCHRTV